jgi:Xrn1 SH3-like domain
MTSMSKRKFKVGDRVIATRTIDQRIAQGSAGTIVDARSFGVHWDEKFPGGHDCLGRCPWSHGYYVEPVCIELLEDHDDLYI